MNDWDAHEKQYPTADEDYYGNPAEQAEDTLKGALGIVVLFIIIMITAGLGFLGFLQAWKGGVW